MSYKKALQIERFGVPPTRFFVIFSVKLAFFWLPRAFFAYFLRIILNFCITDRLFLFTDKPAIDPDNNIK